MKLTIHGYSTALFATWFFIEELGLLFDAGDGVIANLMGKTGKIKNVFISHADRDHLAGLLAYNQLCAHHKPVIHYPEDANSFRFLSEFANNFDPQNSGTIWKGIIDRSVIDVKQNFIVEAVQNEHVLIPGQKSLSYKVFEVKRKLKEELRSLSKAELINVKKEKGDAFLTDEIKTNILSYSGDTPVTNYNRFNGSKVLIHEATFLSKEETQTKNDKNKHSSVEEVFKMVADNDIEQLVLSHFSSRYEQAQIDEKIKEQIALYNIKIPVYRIPLGRTVRNILNTNPIN